MRKQVNLMQTALSRHVTRIQAAWRGWCGRELSRELDRQRRDRREKMRGQVYDGADVAIADFAARREEIRASLLGLPPFFLERRGMGALSNPAASERVLIRACLADLDHHNANKAKQ